MAITLEAGVGLGANPIYHVRHRGAAAALAARPRAPAGRSAGSASPSPTPAATPAAPAPGPSLDEADGRVGDRRREGVHHQLGHADHLARHGHRPHRRRQRRQARDLARSSSRRARRASRSQPPYRKMGWHASDTHGLTFADCRVPADHLLGERGPRASPTSSPSSTTAASPSPPSPSA